MKAAGALRPRSVRRVAIIGPGLDFADKQEGYDFYPQQTIQPFALIDSLGRPGWPHQAGVEVTAFDLSRAVLEHLEIGACPGGRRGHLHRRAAAEPRSAVDRRIWSGSETASAIEIGRPAGRGAPPSNAGHVDVRSVVFPPPVARAIVPRDLNVVLQRIEPLTGGERFDLIVATNILLYYDVFEQSLAAANIAAMLRPGRLPALERPDLRAPGRSGGARRGAPPPPI